MPATPPPNGFWKGLAINSSNQIRVNLYLHFENGSIVGRFELPGHRGPVAEGSVTGYSQDLSISLSSTTEGLRFEGRALPGSKGKWMIYGAIRFAEPDERLTSLTVFHTPQEIEVFAGAWNSDDFHGPAGPPPGD